MKIIILIGILLQSAAIQAVYPTRELTTNWDISTRNRGISQNSLDHMNRPQYVKGIACLGRCHAKRDSARPSSILFTNPKQCAYWTSSDYYAALAHDYGIPMTIENAGSIAEELRYYHCPHDQRNFLYIPEYVITNIMHQEKLYAHKNFIDFIKKFDWYEDELLALHDKIMHRHDSWKSFFKKKFSDQVIAALVSESNRIVNARQEKRIREAERAVIKNNFQNELRIVESSIDEQQELHEIAHTYNLHNKNHYETRLAALDDVLGNKKYTQKSYSLNNDVLTLLSQTGCNTEQYKTNYGNQLQQVIHQECIDIISQTMQLSVHSPLYDYKNSLVNFADSGRSYNQEGSSGKAMQINDFCYALLDYGSAIVEGIACGVIGAAKDMINHPVQTALCVVAGEYVLAYQLLKVTTNLASIGISYAFDKEAGAQQWHDYIEPITSVISAIHNKELTLRDGIKGAVTLGTGMYAQGKMLKGLNSFYSTTKAKALEFAKNNPLATPAEYVTTPEGVLFKVVNEVNNRNTHLENPPLHPKTPSREVIFPKVKTYEQARNQALEIIGKVDPHSGKPSVGNLGVGEGKLVGRAWDNGKVAFRIDYDPHKGPHLNVNDFRLGKKMNALKYVIPFEGSEETIKGLLRHLNTEAELLRVKNIFSHAADQKSLTKITVTLSKLGINNEL